jgi:hypothetical protein
MEKRYFEGYLENGQFYAPEGSALPRTGKTKAMIIMLEEPPEAPKRLPDMTPQEREEWLEKLQKLRDEAEQEEFDESLFIKPRWGRRDDFGDNSGVEHEICAGCQYNNQIFAQ